MIPSDDCARMRATEEKDELRFQQLWSRSSGRKGGSELVISYHILSFNELHILNIRNYIGGFTVLLYYMS